jgi:hypothetical protein
LPREDATREELVKSSILSGWTWLHSQYQTSNMTYSTRHCLDMQNLQLPLWKVRHHTQSTKCRANRWSTTKKILVSKNLCLKKSRGGQSKRNKYLKKLLRSYWEAKVIIGIEGLGTTPRRPAVHVWGPNWVRGWECL